MVRIPVPPTQLPNGENLSVSKGDPFNPPVLVLFYNLATSCGLMDYAILESPPAPCPGSKAFQRTTIRKGFRGLSVILKG